MGKASRTHLSGIASLVGLVVLLVGSCTLRLTPSN
jgi:hypothetical protein